MTTGNDTGKKNRSGWRANYFAILLLVLGLTAAAFSPAPLRAQDPEQHQREQSCRSFVQEFYNWYLARSAADQKSRKAGPAGSAVLRSRPQVLGPDLAQLLRADNEAQAKAHELVGLDFDPFFNSQDPSSKFVVESVHVNDGHCQAVVNGIEQGTKQERVVPELMGAGQGWVFVNFHYGKSESSGESNLIGVLKDLAAERRKHRR